MMTLTTITYTRKKNLGNYQNEDVTATINLTSDESPVVAYWRLRAFVLGQLGLADEADEAVGAAGLAQQYHLDSAADGRTAQIMPVGWEQDLVQIPVPASARTERRPRG